VSELPGARSTAPIHYTPPQLAERILAEQAALEARGQSDGERKTITALFADMAGSTALIHDRDPEEAHLLITPVIALMMEAVHHFEGYVAKSLGDGILALFGAPIANEDHPQRALYAALRMQEAMRRHADRLRLEQGISLQIRVGINTGEVVVRSIRKDDLRTDYDPVGHTIHVASRMETMAAPSSILVSESTHKLTEGYFKFKALGDTYVKGIPQPLAVYEVLGLGALRTRLQLSVHRGLSRFVGREAELEALHGALDQVAAGHGQIVAVEGEAGVGKSRLFLEFKQRSAEQCLVLETFSVSHGKSFAYLPLIELLRNYFQITVQDDEKRSREKVIGKVLTLESSLEDCVPYLLYLLGVAKSGSAQANMDPRVRRERTFDAITRLLVQESINKPVELLFEDLQWLDSETEAFLSFLIERVASARILLLVNCRPEYQFNWWQNGRHTQLRLTPLGEAEAQGLLSALVGNDPTLAPLKKLILEKTEGNPFFMEEAVQALVEEKALLGAPGQYRAEKSPSALHIPTTVQGVLAARIDRLPPKEKALLQTLAVIGKEFSWSLIVQVCSAYQGAPSPSKDELSHLLSRLEAGEFVYEQPAFPEVEYAFKHALTQEVARGSLLAEQRSVVHERTAQAIEVLFPSRLKDYYGELAHHYTLSGNIPKAVEYLHRAGEQAIERSATHEAAQHLGTALELLKRLPDTTERARQELTMQLLLGPVLMAARGYGAPEVEAVYTRALELCKEVGESSELFQALLGLLSYSALHGKYVTARQLGEELLGFAEDAREPGLLVEAYSSLGTTLFFQGEFAAAIVRQQQGLSLYKPHQHHVHAFIYGTDPGIRDLSLLAWTMWYQGYPDRARQRCQEALALAQKMSHPFSSAFTLVAAAMLHQFRREAQLVQDRAESAIALSTEQGFPFWLGWGSVLRGWALAEQGRIEEGIAQITQGLSIYRAGGAELGLSYVLGLLASAYGHAGQVQFGLNAITDALAMVERTGERYYDAELHRLKGELILQQSDGQPDGDTEEAERYFHKAIEVACNQGAKSLELRATLSLIRLWQRQGGTEAASQRLNEIYSFFTEGFDTADLREAKALLDDLSMKRILGMPPSSSRGDA